MMTKYLGSLWSSQVLIIIRGLSSMFTSLVTLCVQIYSYKTSQIGLEPILTALL